MAVASIGTKELFDDFISRPDLTVMHFFADWVEECVTMDRILQAHALEIKEANFCNVDAELMGDIALKYDITSVPTIVLFRSGLVVGRVVGVNAAQLNKQIKQLLVKGDAESMQDALESRLKGLINSAPVMLFMKGNALEPKCGFSKQIVAILNEMKAEYKTFDILSDEQVRQGLKTFSNWPTYPQLYIKGDLVGGLDIVKEMKENGELALMLPKKENIEDRCRSLISSHPCMVFMKGDKHAPKCGFSRRLMDILKETGVEFQTFDILQDEDVRQGLKTYSDWPTYPQVYVQGTLIGGLDIIEELKATDELLSTLKGER